MNPQVETQHTSIRYVRSFTNPNQFYVVALNPRGFWECDCPAAQFNRRTPCKHARAVAKDNAGLVAQPKRRPVTVAPAPRRSQAEMMADFGLTPPRD